MFSIVLDENFTQNVIMIILHKYCKCHHTMSTTTYHWDVYQWRLIMTTLTHCHDNKDSIYRLKGFYYSDLEIIMKYL